jgi:hypothetical protein
MADIKIDYAILEMELMMVVLAFLKKNWGLI